MGSEWELGGGWQSLRQCWRWSGVVGFEICLEGQADGLCWRVVTGVSRSGAGIGGEEGVVFKAALLGKIQGAQVDVNFRYAPSHF